MSDSLLSLILAKLEQIEARLPAGAAPLEDRSLTRQQAAAYLGVHEKTLAHLTTRGQVNGYRAAQGGRWKYRLADLERYREQLPQSASKKSPVRAVDWGQ